MELLKIGQSSEVDIYMGTWCGDRNYGLYFLFWDRCDDSDEKYKQGPNGEEKGKNIARRL